MEAAVENELKEEPYTFRFTEPERRVFKPKEKIKMSEWAAWHRIVTVGALQGIWRNELTPYTGIDYARQLLGEEKRRTKNNRMEWVLVRNNHLLDCEVDAAACADNEWLPSLKMLASYLDQKDAKKEGSEQTVTPKAKKSARW